MRVKFRLKISNCLGKMSENVIRGIFLTHTVQSSPKSDNMVLILRNFAITSANVYRL